MTRPGAYRFYGRKLSIVIACLVMGSGTILVGAVPDFWAALVGWAVWGFGATFMSGAYEAWITDEVGAENVGPVFVRGMQVSYAAALVGLPLWIGLATVSLQGAVIANGALTLAVGLIAIPLMPETGFNPVPRDGRTRRQAMARTARDGVRLIRVRPVLLLLLGTAFFAGAYSEGFDRLWEAFFLRDIGLPAFRATVISMTGQSDAVGQFGGGPAIGAIGNAFGIRAALVASGLVLTPALALYGWATRHREDETALQPVEART